MSRAQIKFEASERFTIDGVTYRVAEHPALPGIPYVQRGGRGFVVQLLRPDSDRTAERMALKYFKLKYRVRDLVTVATALRQFADLPGMRAARRTVFTPATHTDLINRYPALEYGMLMPWLPGVTWYDLVTTKAPLSPAEGVRLAQSTARILAGLETQRLAHCDIAGANVMVDRRGGQVELVDIEEMFGPGLPQPVEPPAGQDGYQHRESRAKGQWTATGDRFGAAILLAEMLGWTNGRIRVNSADEHFFATAEMQDPDSIRFRLLREVLRDDFGEPVAELLQTAWSSDSLAACPTLDDWRTTLDALKVELKAAPAAVSAPGANPATASAPVKAPDSSGKPIITGRRSVSVTIPGTSTTLSTQPPAEVPDAQASPAPVDNTPRVQLDHTRLCRNCGEPNDTRESFCKRCGFYIGTGARKPVAVQIPTERGAKGQPTAKMVVPPPQQVGLNRNLNEVVTARRVGAPGKGGLTRIETPHNRDDMPVEANSGSWIVVAIVAAFVITLIVLLLLSGGGVRP